MIRLVDIEACCIMRCDIQLFSRRPTARFYCHRLGIQLDQCDQYALTVYHHHARGAGKVD